MSLFRKVQKENPHLQFSAARREAARQMGVDYKHFMDVLTKRIPSGVTGAPPPKAALLPRTKVRRSPAPKAPTSKYSEVVSRNEYDQEVITLKWGRKVIGEITEVKTEYVGGDFTSVKYRTRLKSSGAKSRGAEEFGNIADTDNLDGARRRALANFAMDVDVKDDVARLLKEADLKTHTGSWDKSWKMTDTDYRPDRNSLKGDEAKWVGPHHWDDVKSRLDDSVHKSGDRVHDNFGGFKPFHGGSEIAHYQGGVGRQIAVNPKYANLPAEDMDKLHHDGQWSQFYTKAAHEDSHGTGMSSSIAHEYGHHIQSSIDDYLAARQLPVSMFADAGPLDPEDMIAGLINWRAEQAAAKQIVSEMYKDFLTSIEKTWRLTDRPLSIVQKRALADAQSKKTMTGKDFSDFMSDFSRTTDSSIGGNYRVTQGDGRLVRQDWEDVFSKYGGVNDHEFFAEVWAEYSGPRARPQVMLIGNTIQRTLAALERLHKGAI